MDHGLAKIFPSITPPILQLPFAKKRLIQLQRESTFNLFSLEYLKQSLHSETFYLCPKVDSIQYLQLFLLFQEYQQVRLSRLLQYVQLTGIPWKLTSSLQYIRLPHQDPHHIQVPY